MFTPQKPVVRAVLRQIHWQLKLFDVDRSCDVTLSDAVAAVAAEVCKYFKFWSAISE